MNVNAFWISFGIGVLISLVVCFRFSRSGSHARFRPALGVVAIVFVVMLGVVAFISSIIANAVGNKIPPVSGDPPSSESTKHHEVAP